MKVNVWLYHTTFYYLITTVFRWKHGYIAAAWHALSRRINYVTGLKAVSIVASSLLN